MVEASIDGGRRMRTRWAAIGAAVAVSLGAGGIGIGQATTSSGERPIYLPIEPCRLADTRPAPNTVGPRTTPIGADETYSIDGWGTVGDCELPSGTAGLSLNVTAVGATAQTNLRFFPADAAVPNAANLNPTPGAPPTPNAVNVDLDDTGRFSVYNRFGSVAVVIDVVGIYDDHHHDDRYYTEAEIDSLIASLPSGPDGAAYKNLIVVAKSGGDFGSVTAAMNAIGSDPAYPAATSDQRYLVWVAPGIYENEDIDMQPYVDIEGSGQGVTVLRSVGGTGGISPDSATLVGADNAELRHITVEIDAASAGNWSFAIYTAGATTFKNVTANARGGAHPRAVMIHDGAAPLLIDVIASASDGSVAVTGVDVFLATMFADGLFATATGGTIANGIFINTVTSEVLIENVTVQAFDASGEVSGLKTNQSSVTVEGLRSVVTGSPSTTANGVWCDDENQTLRVVGAPTIYVESSGAGTARGIFGVDCNLEVRDAVIDAVGSVGPARAIQHIQNDVAQQADVTIADVEARAVSASSNAIALNLAGSGAATFGRVTELNARATGGSTSLNSTAIAHTANGDVQYRGLSLIVDGVANFMYGIQNNGGGVSRYDDVVITAEGEAESTVFGVEFFADSSSLTNARIKAINLASGDTHDAVGVKANGADGVEFVDVTAYAEAESSNWGADLVSSSGTTMSGVDLRTGSTASFGYGIRCWDGSAEVFGSRSRTEAVSSNFGLYAIGSCQIEVRDSLLSGQTASLRTLGTADVLVVQSQLDGGAASSGSATDVQNCIAVTHNSGGETFLATLTNPCP